MLAWSRRAPRTARRVALAAVVAAAALAAGGTSRPLPPIVFVSRVPPTGADAGQVPGLGPHGTFVSAGGRLLERASDGAIRELLAPGTMYDVADPAPAPDGRRVAFAGRQHDRAPWRIWVVDRVTGERRCGSCPAYEFFTEDGRLVPMRYADHADPAWWGDTLVFVERSRVPPGRMSLYGDVAVTQLVIPSLPPSGGEPHPLTFEPNGVLDPVADAGRGRLSYSRWWFNPWGPDSAGALTRGSHRRDTVNTWQVVSARPRRGAHGRLVLEDVRLAAGGVLPRRRGMGLQATVLPNGDFVAVAARNTGLAPRPGPLALLRYRSPGAAGVRIAGAAIGDGADDPYTESANLAAPAACAPAALPDGRLLYSLDPGGRGDFGIVLSDADGRRQEKLVDLPGTWELDAAPVPEPERAAWGGHTSPPRPGGSAPESTFRYLATDVFAGRGAAARRAGARLHVYRVVGADSIERVRSVTVPRNGRVDLALPADTPLFELLTDSTGRVLMSAHGATQVRGFNSGAPGSTARCSGCHLGHSARR
jgi:hypothetical protein